MPTLFEAPPRSTPKKSVRIVEEKKESLPMHVLSTFAYKPKGVHFETQEEGEEVLLFLRQHIILLLPWLVISLALLIIPTIGIPAIIRFLPKPLMIPNGYLIVGTMFWYLAVFGFFLTKIIHWFFNIFIVTNERIVDIDFVNLLYKEFSEAKVTRIQDMSYQTKGILATFFNFGDVLIQTAGEVPNFVFESVPRPAYVVDTISDLIKGVVNPDV
jgi:hypothetical protein